MGNEQVGFPTTYPEVRFKECSPLMTFYPGYHAKSPEEFAEAFHSVFQLSKAEDLALRRRARVWAVKRFSNEEFEKGWDNTRWKDQL
jgi:hypothetical protein